MTPLPAPAATASDHHPLLEKYMLGLEANVRLSREFRAVLEATTQVEDKTREAEAALAETKAALARLKVQVSASEFRVKADAVGTRGFPSLESKNVPPLAPAPAPASSYSYNYLTSQALSRKRSHSLPAPATAQHHQQQLQQQHQPPAKRRDSRASLNLDSATSPTNSPAGPIKFHFTDPLIQTLENGTPNARGYRSWIEVMKGGVKNYVHQSYHKPHMLLFHDLKGLEYVFLKRRGQLVHAIEETHYAAFVEFMRKQLNLHVKARRASQDLAYFGDEDAAKATEDAEETKFMQSTLEEEVRERSVASKKLGGSVDLNHPTYGDAMKVASESLLSEPLLDQQISGSAVSEVGMHSRE